LKIALVILHADPARGGAERYTHDLAAALAKEGHAVSLLACAFADVPPNVKQVTLHSHGATRLGRYLRFLDSLDAQLASENYDIVHAMLPVRRCDIYHPHAGIAAETITAGSVLSRLGNRLNARRHRFATVERELLTGTSPPIVLCLSDYVRSSLLRCYPLPPDRTATLFNAVDLERFDCSDHRGGSGALMIAQDFDRKGLRQAILALAKVPGCPLVVVGGDDPRSYKSLAVSLGIADRVHFAGATTDPRPFYRDADFFVLPTKHDPCSLVVLEALAMGLPVISTRFNGACEIMADGTHGYVLEDPMDVDALAGAMQKVMDPARRAAMSRACIELRPALSYPHHVDRLLEIYRAKSENPKDDCPRRGTKGHEEEIEGNGVTFLFFFVLLRDPSWTILLRISRAAGRCCHHCGDNRTRTTMPDSASYPIHSCGLLVGKNC
jgi:UDP-glucose:(heptosyl)LPS alpha-1,3-glucosyltransferase